MFEYILQPQKINNQYKSLKAMNFCPKCGNKFDKNDQFCSNCGTLCNRLGSEKYTSYKNEFVDIDNVNDERNDLVFKKPITMLDASSFFTTATIFVDGKLLEGLIDFFGNWIIDPKYENLGYFDDEGFCKAKVDGIYGWINPQGNWIIPATFEYVEDFDRNGYCKAKIDGKYGFINRKGEWIINPTFDYVYEFKNDFAISEKNEKYGLINREGRWAIDPIYDSLQPNNDNLYLAEVGGKYGFLNSNGNWMIHPLFDELDDEFDNLGYCKASIDEKFGFINKIGKWIIFPIFKNLGNFDTKNRCSAIINDKFGFIDRKGNWIPFSNKIIQKSTFYQNHFDDKDRCNIYLNDKVGIINSSGNWLIKPQFSWIGDFNNLNRCFFREKVSGFYKYGLMNDEGTIIVPAIFDDIHQNFLPYPNAGFLDESCLNIVKKDDKFGMINSEGIWLLKPKFYVLESTEYSNIFKAAETNKYGYIDIDGNWIIHPQFDYIKENFMGDLLKWNELKKSWEY